MDPYALFSDEPTDIEQAKALAEALRGQRGMGQAFAMHPLLAQAGRGMLQDAAQQEEALARGGQFRAQGRLQKALAAQSAATDMDKLRYQNSEEWRRLQATLGAKSQEDAAKRAEALSKSEAELRKELGAAPITKDTMNIAGAYEGVKSALSAKTPAGDMAGIFTFMKTLDPGSTVNRGEYASASNTANVPDQIRNMYNQALQGTLLTDKQRKDFIGTARNKFKSQINVYNKQLEGYRKLAPPGSNFENIAPWRFEVDEDEAAPSAATATPGAMMLNGKRMVRQPDGTYLPE